MARHSIPLVVVFRFSCRSTKTCTPTEIEADAADEDHLLAVIAESRRLRRFCGHCGSQDIQNEIVIRRKSAE